MVCVCLEIAIFPKDERFDAENAFNIYCNELSLTQKNFHLHKCIDHRRFYVSQFRLSRADLSTVLILKLRSVVKVMFAIKSLQKIVILRPFIYFKIYIFIIRHHL